MTTAVGRKRASKVWHLLRHPLPGELTQLLSFCSHLWQVEETKMGEVTCKFCIARLRVGLERWTRLRVLEV